MNGAQWINWATNLITIVITSGIGVLVLQKVFDRKVNKQEIEREEQDAIRRAEHDREEKSRRAREAEELLAASRATAQKTALDSANSAFKTVKAQCDDCLDQLHGMRDICGNLIDALEALMAEDTAAARADARASVRLARRAM